MDILESIISWGNHLLWSKVLIVMLIGLGVYFTFKTRFVQFKLFGEMFRLLKEGVTPDPTQKKAVSSFQAFCISTASRVGTGNMAGVALAISLGGPGAVFWMWLIALIGAASSFVESTLAQIYKVKDGNGFRGGPAYYMEKGLNQRWMGVLFAVLITITFGLVFNSVQSNTIAHALEEAWGIDRGLMGLILAVVVGLIIFGGVKRIARVSAVIVPVMAIFYVAVALFVVIKNVTMIPEVLMLIIGNAFGLQEVVGGGLGAALMNGIKRGLFSNEAGMGSAPNAAAAAAVSHPVKQGLIQSLSVFTDTLIICSATAFIILMSGIYLDQEINGIALTQAALSTQVGDWATGFVAIAILLFAFSSLIGNYYYGETNIEFIRSSKTWLTIYRLAVIGMVAFGSVAQLSLVWDMADLFMGLMAIINLIAIALLGKFAFAALQDYVEQRREGKDPVFRADRIEGLVHAECWDNARQRSEK
ncbi:amino acid carrier protein [Caldalkalibacillus thermarum TA2.A1]|uniref:Alanine:cation symporter family protein n=1 Tax=Caldalkalibacillus thermarum (strain TA2.A1) TaxID=986075 RepID=F5LA31_CALTT|nr:alanine/glycine:cation symporter family protein [Caldalkalibacillus thermarum]EGL81751.1 amino acid carrier protein [Caldalkalibacillus thermarum TA2.A1]QZT34129.1 alanine:cation symporter family protein [Caldalkalibacillus thermarum TA2.A1]